MISSIFITLLVITVHVDSILVRTKLGQILGVEETTKDGQYKYFAFRSIPYAVPPTNQLRFKEPVPISAWEGVFNATLDGEVCPQLHIGQNQVIGDENCLTVNVYTRDLDSFKNVVVFIHGGGFNTGSSSSQLYGPDYIIRQDVVLVTVQYRLGPLGFLSTADGSTPGNWGLHDQIEALRWVQENVGAFGGDPDKVTLIGEGAGAASAILLTLTMKSKGLFRNVIALGGNPLSSQYFQGNPVESARELGSRLQCAYDDFPELVECLRKTDVQTLVKETNQMFNFFSFPRWFAPVKDSVLFDKTPREILSSGKFLKVPVLTGISKHEGAFYVPLTLNSFNDGKYDGAFIDQRLPRMLPVISEFQSKLFPITKALKKRYFNNINVDNEAEFMPRYIELLTDLLFTRGASEYGTLLEQHNVPVYYYLFDYHGENSIMNVLGFPDIKSVAHGDIIQYIFSGLWGEEKDLPENDKGFATSTLIPLIINFVKTSNPTPTESAFGLLWPKFTKETQNVFSIGRKLQVLPKFRTGILRFWAEEITKIVKPKKQEL